MLRRHIIDRLLDGLGDTPAVLVNGARQTGKSTLVQSAELTEQKLILVKAFDEVVKSGRLQEVMDEIVLQSKVEFNYNDEDEEENGIEQLLET